MTCHTAARRHRPVLIATSALLLGCIASGCGARTDASSDSDGGGSIHGVVRIEYDGGPSYEWVQSHVSDASEVDDLVDPGPGAECPMLPGGDASLPGSQIEVLDSSDKVVGVGELASDGSWTRADDQLTCELAFQVDDDLPDSDFYRLSIEGAGTETIRADETDEPVELTVKGDSSWR